MSDLTSAWEQLYEVQTEVIGAITATIEGVAVAKPCIPTDSPWNRVHAEDGGGEEWEDTRELQMLASDLNFQPPEFAAVTISDDDRAAQLVSWRVNNGIYYLTVEFKDAGVNAFAYLQPDGSPYYQPDTDSLYLQPN